MIKKWGFGTMKGVEKMKRLKLKRKWVVVITIIITLFSVKMYNITINRINTIKKEANKCDQSKGYTCSYYEIRQYLINR